MRDKKTLSHYGVKGMKWGVHRSEGSASTGSHESNSDDFTRAQASTRRITENHGTHVLSNKDLQELVSRMNLEQQYSRLLETQQGPQGIEKAKKFVGNVNFVGRTTNDVISFVNSPAGKLIRKTVLGA